MPALATLYSPLRKVVQATSDGSGNATFSFDRVTPHTVWRGSVFIDQAPASVSARVTVGGISWGTTTGGAALQVEALESEQVQVTATGLAVSTTYQAYFIGNELHKETAAGVGFISPFPGTSH